MDERMNIEAHEIDYAYAEHAETHANGVKKAEKSADDLVNKVCESHKKNKD